MGDIISKVKLCGLSRDGKLQRDWRRCPEVDALVDTGATATVIPRYLAALAGARVVPGLRHMQRRPYDGAMVALRVEGCPVSPHVAVVSDRLASRAKPAAEIILGHDYLQDNRVRIDYEDRRPGVTCPPRKPRNGKGGKGNGGNGRQGR